MLCIPGNSNNMDRKKKIIVVMPLDGSIKTLLNAQLLAAMKAGYDVHCACTKGNHFGFFQKEGVIAHNIPISRSMTPFRDIFSFFKLYQLLRKEKYVIFHAHSPKVSLLGQLTAKLAGVPVIINTVHGYYFHDHMKPIAKWFYIAMEWIASRCSTKILSQNPEDIETAVRLKICRREKIRLLGNGIDLSIFDFKRFDTLARQQKRRQIGLPEEAVVLGILGRLVKEKGFLELFQSIKPLMDQYENLWLVIIGPEESEKSDRISGHTFQEYGIGNRTIWLGLQPHKEVPSLFSCFDIYTLPSWREGFPRSAIEAAAMGLPIVTYNIRGSRQVVNDGVNGFLVPLHNISALTEALNKLIKDPALRQKMGQAGYERAQVEFDEQKVCKIVLDTYEEELRKLHRNSKDGKEKKET